ncbi:hypothetical protein CFP75_29185 [Amycolatopsis alba DSM 44262]|uniref:Uncharacterized protein n=1 Tax=Amycolatopsis alba DSM 44262 TaxID=1125972 RepID=A0A229RI17_AMYAL|nr:hypothetical protein CFP75_29185 [Amycolatopsis alba DSM 44262]
MSGKSRSHRPYHSRDPRSPGVQCGLAGRACCESHFRNVEGCESGFRNATSGARAWTVGRSGVSGEDGSNRPHHSRGARRMRPRSVAVATAEVRESTPSLV